MPSASPTLFGYVFLFKKSTLSNTLVCITKVVSEPPIKMDFRKLNIRSLPCSYNT